MPYGPGRYFAADTSAPATGSVAKAVIDVGEAGENLLDPQGWRAWEQGFRRERDVFACDNGADLKVQRGTTQTVVLDQTQPEPIVAVAFSKAEGVTGSADTGYSLYLDLLYVDGDHLWGQTANFSTGTHDWQRRQVVVLPGKTDQTGQLPHAVQIARRKSPVSRSGLAGSFGPPREPRCSTAYR